MSLVQDFGIKNNKITSAHGEELNKKPHDADRDTHGDSVF